MDRTLELPATAGLPRTFLSKTGERFSIELLQEADHQGLVAMYLAYQPRDSFEGLPPVRDDACVRWVQEMIHDGINLVAIAVVRCVVGHAALFPLDRHTSEMLIAICPGYRNAGIGTELAHCCLRVAEEVGFERVWLAVEAKNLRARRLFKECGFVCLSADDHGDLEMVADLKRWQTGR